MHISDWVTIAVVLASPIWGFCVVWYLFSKAEIRNKMKEGLTFKESVRWVFKESLANRKGEAFYQHDNRYKNVADDSSSRSSVQSFHTAQPSWYTDPKNSHQTGNVFNHSYPNNYSKD
jgi:hypothetical protein